MTKRRSVTPEPALIRSRERVRTLGEVLTPASLVADMLEVLPPEVWDVHPAKTFLEPTCGDGNFLVAILDRKLRKVADEWKSGSLPAGASSEACSFHMLESLSSIYGIELSADNVEGGGPQRIVGARQRMLGVFRSQLEDCLGARPSAAALRTATSIIRANVQVGNFLTFKREGNDIPLFEYVWSPETMAVEITRSTYTETFSLPKHSSPLQLSLDFSQADIVYSGPVALFGFTELSPRGPITGSLGH